MQTLSEINKIIKLNGSFNIHIPCEIMIDWGNCTSATGRITVSHNDDNGYMIHIYNVNEYSLYHATQYTYYIKVSTPFGWTMVI